MDKNLKGFKVTKTWRFLIFSIEFGTVTTPYGKKLRRGIRISIKW